MSDDFNEELNFEKLEHPVIQYRVWTLIDRKWTSFTILFITSLLTFAVYHATGKLHLAFVVLIMLLGGAWRVFIPMQFELSSEGIIRWTLGHRRDIAWPEICSYTVQEDGILILPHRRRYPLDAFRGLFIPVPKKFRAQVQRRFAMYALKTSNL